MMPPATTPAGKPAKRAKRSSARPATPTARGTSHRATVRSQTALSAPRRVSGPLGGVTRDRRVSGPTPPAARPQPRRQPTAHRVREPLGARAVAYVRALPDHQWLDRIVRGRAWIPLLGMLLAGIVAMQVEVLKLGAGIGRAIELSSTLQSRNELLRASVATLSDDQRIESEAAAMGMVMPAPAEVNFLSLRPAGAVQRAVANIHPPDPAGFTAALPALASTSSSNGATTSSSGQTSSSNSASTPSSGQTSSSNSASTPSSGQTSSSTGG